MGFHQTKEFLLQPQKQFNDWNDNILKGIKAFASYMYVRTWYPHYVLKESKNHEQKDENSNFYKVLSSNQTFPKEATLTSNRNMKRYTGDHDQNHNELPFCFRMIGYCKKDKG